MMTMAELEAMARADARGDHTGWAHWRGIRCAYYPVSKRYRWFNQYGPANRRDIALRVENA
jgi:hypothetical protein